MTAEDRSIMTFVVDFKDDDLFEAFEINVEYELGEGSDVEAFLDDRIVDSLIEDFYRYRCRELSTGTFRIKWLTAPIVSDLEDVCRRYRMGDRGELTTTKAVLKFISDYSENQSLNADYGV